MNSRTKSLGTYLKSLPYTLLCLCVVLNFGIKDANAAGGAVIKGVMGLVKNANKFFGAGDDAAVKKIIEKLELKRSLGTSDETLGGTAKKSDIFPGTKVLVGSDDTFIKLAKSGDPKADHKYFVSVFKGKAKKGKVNYKLPKLVILGAVAGVPALATFRLRAFCTGTGQSSSKPSYQNRDSILPNKTFCDEIESELPALFVPVDREKQIYQIDVDLDVETLELIIEEIKVLKSRNLKKQEFLYYQQLASDQMVMRKKIKMKIYYKLARFYETGLGTKTDIKKAYPLYLKAATMGWPPAQTKVARLLYTGECVCAPTDLVAALSWITLASDPIQVGKYMYGDLKTKLTDDAKNMKELLSEILTSEQLKRAKEDAENFLIAIAEHDKNLSSYVPIISNSMTKKINPTALNIDLGKYFGLVIGISNYKKLPKLKNALGDAEMVTKILREKYKFEVRFMADPTRKEIYHALNDFRKKLTENDNFLIYYAGHGVIDEDLDNEGYWQPSNGIPDDDSSWVPVRKIQDTIKVIKSRHVIVIADSCFGGTVFKTRGLSSNHLKQVIGLELIKRLHGKKSGVAITSGYLEPVSDSDASSNHSPFAGKLIRLLGENRQLLSASRLHHKLRKEVTPTLPLYNPQYAGMYPFGHRGGDFVFVPRHLVVQN